MEQFPGEIQIIANNFQQRCAGEKTNLLLDYRWHSLRKEHPAQALEFCQRVGGSFCPSHFCVLISGVRDIQRLHRGFDLLLQLGVACFVNIERSSKAHTVHACMRWRIFTRQPVGMTSQCEMKSIWRAEYGKSNVHKQSLYSTSCQYR